MNNIEILENFIDKQKSNKGTFVPTDFEIKSLENMIKEYKDLKEKIKGLECEIEIKKYCKVDEVINDLTYYKNLAKEYQGNCIPKSKVKELAKKYEFALNDYDSSTADYKHSQNIGKYMACIELLEERKLENE